MKKILFFAFILLIAFVMFNFSSGSAQLGVGDQAPEFELIDQDGNTVCSADIFGNNPVVIYFYPKDDTPGCTKEACSFRDSYTAFTDLGVKVFGVSADSPASHKAFAQKYRLPYTLLSDTDNKLRKAFGVKSDLFGLIPGRVTFVVDNQGVIQHVFNSQMQAEKHIDESLEAIKKMLNE